MNRVEAGQTLLNMIPIRFTRFINAERSPRVLCSVRDSAGILEPHPNAISHEPGRFHPSVEAAPSLNPCEANISRSGCRRKL